MNRRVLFITGGVALVIAIGVTVWILIASPFSSSDTPPTPSATPLDDGFLPITSVGPLTTPSTPPLAFGGVCSDTWAGQQDIDRDLLPDAVEATYGTDQSKADTDGDGYNDGEEVRAGYNPLNRDSSSRLDSDNDELFDHEECQWGTDSFNPDSDSDGFKDGAEVANGFDPAKKGDGNGSDRIAVVTPAPIGTPLIDLSQPTPTPIPIFTNNPGFITPTPVSLPPVAAQFALIPLSQLNITPAAAPADVRTYLAQIDALRPPELSDGQAIASAVESAASGNVQQLAQVRARIGQFAAALKGATTPKPAQEYQQLYVSLIDFTVSRLQVIEQNAAGDQQKAVQAVLDMQNVLPSHVTQLSQLRTSLEGFAAQ